MLIKGVIIMPAIAPVSSGFGGVAWGDGDAIVVQPTSSGIASHNPKSEGQLEFARELRDSMSGEGEKGNGFPIPQLPATTQTPADAEQGLKWLDAAKQQDGQSPSQDMQPQNHELQVSGQGVDPSNVQNTNKSSRVRRSAGGDGSKSYNLQKARYEGQRDQLSKFYAEAVERGTQNHVVSWFSRPWLSNASNKRIVFNFERYRVQGEGPDRYARKYRDDFGYSHSTKSIEIGAESWEYMPSDTVFWIDGAYGTDGWFSAKPEFMELTIAPEDATIITARMIKWGDHYTVKIPTKAVAEFYLSIKRKPPINSSATIESFVEFFSAKYDVKLAGQVPRGFTSYIDSNGDFVVGFVSDKNLGRLGGNVEGLSFVRKPGK